MSRKRDPNREYDHESLRDEREYGFYWYSGLWNILRPVLIVLASLLIVFGLASGVFHQPRRSRGHAGVRLFRGERQQPHPRGQQP